MRILRLYMRPVAAPRAVAFIRQNGDPIGSRKLNYADILFIYGTVFLNKRQKTMMTND